MKNTIDLCLLTPIDIFGMTIDERREYIEMAMKAQYLGKKYYCPALSCDVSVNQRGIHETAVHAAKSVESTIVALNLHEVIENAQFIRFDKPKKGVQTKRFRAAQTLILRTYFNKLTAFLTIVETKNGARIEYCATGKKMIPNWLKIKLSDKEPIYPISPRAIK
ncbi:MAG: hypothetical protein IKR17_03695 [Bacteroidales bacterium]|nr:hypothetical protein [Bacteroidales bacterium]